MTRLSAAILWAGLLGTVEVFGFAFAGLALAGDSVPCTIATSGNSQPAKACAKGGRTEAKKTMKGMVADAKTKGQKFTCEGCHKDLDAYELTKNARDDLKKLEALTAKH